MKKILLYIIIGVFALKLTAQTGPVANDDFASCRLGETITIDVLDNDTHPSGLNFYIRQCNFIHTDSTITFFANYEQYCNRKVTDTIKINYLLIDENNNIGENSVAFLNIIITDNNFYDFLDINNIRAQIQASGIQFFQGPFTGNSSVITNTPDNLFEFPKGSGKNTIFSSSLWVGGFDENRSFKIAAETFRLNGIDYWTGPISVNNDQLNVSTETAIQWQKVWKINISDIKYHVNHFNDDGYQPIEAIATWPAHGDTELNQNENLAPFVDVDGDKLYDPFSGDYPLMRGDQCIYFIINDVRQHTETDGDSLGLEIHGMAYEFDPDKSPALANTLFMNYKVFNRSSINYKDIYIGLFTDFDIGNAGDDFVGCDVSRGAFYGYNGDSIDGINDSVTYGKNWPAQGIVILGGPNMDENDADNPDGQCDESLNGIGFSDGVVDNERFGMSNFIYFNNGNHSYMSDPDEPEDYYNYMMATWKDGSIMEFGGMGHVNYGAYGPAARFMFPGNSDPCYWGTYQIEPFGSVNWTEETAGNKPGDRRGLSAMGPFTFETNTMESVDIAYVSAFAENGNTAVETLLGYIDDVKKEYFQNPQSFGCQWLGNEENPTSLNNNMVKVFPNPAKNYITISSDFSDESVVYKVIDMLGNKSNQGIIQNGSSVTISVKDLIPGVYFVVISHSQGVCSSKLIKK